MSSPLYQFIFPKLNWFHKTNTWEEVLFPKKNSFPVKCEMTAEYNHNDSDFVETLIKRKITEKCSLQQLLKGLTKQEEAEEYVEGEIEISYKTHKKNKKILSGEITIKLFHYGEIYQKSYLHFKN